MSRKKIETVDISIPLPSDLNNPIEIKTLVMDGDSVVAVSPEPETIVLDPSSSAMDEALDLVDTLAQRCSDGWTPSLSDLRELRLQMAQLK